VLGNLYFANKQRVKPIEDKYFQLTGQYSDLKDFLFCENVQLATALIEQALQDNPFESIVNFTWLLPQEEEAKYQEYATHYMLEMPADMKANRDKNN